MAKKLLFDFDLAAVLEVKMKTGWFRVAAERFRSFDGERRITAPIAGTMKLGDALTQKMSTVAYEGPVYQSGTNKTVDYTGTGKFLVPTVYEREAVESSNDLKLTEKEKQSLKVLNFVATFDGVITDESEIRYLLTQGIQKFVAEKRQYLVSLTETASPIRAKW
jgi:hypothetical protein